MVSSGGPINHSVGNGKLRGVAAEALGIDVGELPEDASVDTVPEWTSLQHLSLMAAVEEQCGIQMSMEEMMEAQSLSLLSTIIKRHFAEQGRA